MNPPLVIFSSAFAFRADAEALAKALAATPGWPEALGATVAVHEPPARWRLAHAATGATLDVRLTAFEGGSRLRFALEADACERDAMGALAAAIDALFAALEARLGAQPLNRQGPAVPTTVGPTGDPPRVQRRADLVWEPVRYPDDPSETLGHYVQLEGLTQCGADVLRLLPGERNARYHVELHEEEAFYVLTGRCVFEVEGRAVVLGPGDFCVTRPGEGHYFANLGAEPCELLAFGGPGLVGSGVMYPYGADRGWRARAEALAGVVESA